MHPSIRPRMSVHLGRETVAQTASSKATFKTQNTKVAPPAYDSCLDNPLPAKRRAYVDLANEGSPYGKKYGQLSQNQVKIDQAHTALKNQLEQLAEPALNEPLEQLRKQANKLVEGANGYYTTLKQETSRFHAVDGNHNLVNRKVQALKDAGKLPQLLENPYYLNLESQYHLHKGQSQAIKMLEGLEMPLQTETLNAQHALVQDVEKFSQLGKTEKAAQVEGVAKKIHSLTGYYKRQVNFYNSHQRTRDDFLAAQGEVIKAQQALLASFLPPKKELLMEPPVADLPFSMLKINTEKKVEPGMALPTAMPALPKLKIRTGKEKE